MVHLRFLPLVAPPMLVLTAVCWGQPTAPDKSGYHLFNPTPRQHMRPLSADRPDATESPITVDAGHYQIELSYIDYTHDDDDSTNPVRPSICSPQARV